MDMGHRQRKFSSSSLRRWIAATMDKRRAELIELLGLDGYRALVRRLDPYITEWMRDGGHTSRLSAAIEMAKAVEFVNPMVRNGLLCAAIEEQEIEPGEV